MAKPHKFTIVERVDAYLWSDRALEKRIIGVRYNGGDWRMWLNLLSETRTSLVARFVIHSFIGIFLLGMAWMCLWLEVNLGSIIFAAVILLASLVTIYDTLKLGFYLFISNRNIMEELTRTANRRVYSA